MASNGTSPLPLYSPSPHVSDVSVMSEGTQALDAAIDPSVLSNNMSTIVDNPQGRPSSAAGAMPSWNPAALLQPNRRTASATDFRNAAPNQPAAWQQAPHPQDRTDSSNSMVFQFASPSETPVATPPNMDIPSPGQVPSANGVGGWIERMNNVQNRSVVPQAKRRRLDEGDDSSSGPNAPMRGSSGVLAEYVRERRKEANNGAASSRASTVDLTDATDDDTQELRDPREEEVCYGMIKTTLNCTKVPSPKPGMQIMWGPGYHPSVKVLLRRSADDRTLRIPVCDHTREMIGLVDNSGAAALAPLLDTNIRMRTDCRIPPQPKRPGEEPGLETSRPYILEVVLYGPIKYARNIGVHLTRHHLRLIHPYMLQRGIRLQNPHSLDYQPPPPRPTRSDTQSTMASTATTRTVEEVRSEVMGVFDSLTRNDDLPGMDPAPCILTPLLKHQRQGLYFMSTREKPRQLQANDKKMVSFWQTRVGPNGQRLYFNVITGQAQKLPPPETRGGILADMMGLGKTLSILSLIASTADEAAQWECLEPEQPSAPEGRPSRNETTLIICPLSTVTNWEEQIKQHVHTGSLSFHIYHGSNRIKDIAKLATFDIVITTYGSVSNELSSRRKGKEGVYPLEELGWFRIVLDEAHMIREQSTMQFKAIVRLQAQRRWAVTGTPVQNRLDDFAALLSFLRLHPFHERGKFLRHIVEPFKACDPEIVPKLRVLVDTITLRRLKDKIDLPLEKIFPDERTIYDLFAKNAQDRVKVLAGSNTDRALGGNTYIHILKAILRLRLLCAHGKDLLNEDDLTALRGMSAEMAIDIDDDDDDGPALSHQKAHEMFKLMQDTNNDACIECSKKLASNDGSNLDAEREDDILGFMTPCFHVVCRSCIRFYQERSQAMMGPGQGSGPCPVCNAHIRLDFVELHREDVDAEHDGPPKSKARVAGKNLDKYDGPHTKTRALLEDLLKSKAASEANPNEPPFKSVVFSGWTSHLDLIEVALKAAGISFTRLDGSMTRTARTAAMDSFRDDNRVHVILVSIMAGGLGLNLTAGSSVYVMEPQYNPAAEAQAIDRVHRLGQKRPVRTVRYIMRDSFEEKMLELQEKKMKLASLSMDGQNKALDKAEAARQKLMDLRSLFK
ncbi:Helicase-like transcription factor [Cladobotryum mycophilum]|uniref:Helicase-like transcription factor n=1 Tax=Cladobotryum mycophilum TaxID=491253 RepID=A0ABR0T2A8_9HYPO